MDKETLSHYGWIVILVLILSVLLALATPFGTFVADGFKATYTGLFQTGTSALDVGLSAVGVKNVLDCGHERNEAGDHTKKECGHYNCDEECGCVPALCGVPGHWSGDGMDHTTVVNHTGSSYATPHTYACQCERWVVPDGCTYKGSKTYVSGEALPCSYTPRNYDKFITSDYEYNYNKIINTTNDDIGWDVVVLDTTKESYEPILDYICNQPVTSFYHTFYNCTNLLVAPELPSTTTILPYTFQGCTSLIKVPTLNGCNNLREMQGTFSGCSALTDASNMNIPNTVIYTRNLFSNCKSLTKTPNYSNATGLKNIQYMFYKCTALEVAPDLSNCVNIENIYSLYQECSSLKSAVVPKTATEISQSLWGCTSLESVYIPKEITRLGTSMFDLCKNIKNVYYGGTQEAFEAMYNATSIHHLDISKATIHYNYNFN